MQQLMLDISLGIGLDNWATDEPSTQEKSKMEINKPKYNGKAPEQHLIPELPMEERFYVPRFGNI